MGSTEYYCDPRRYQSVPLRLYRNLGHGKFEDVTTKSGLGASPGKGMGISIADFNNDGWPDVFIANDTEPNSLFMNRKDGTFEEKGLELGVAYNDSAHTGSSMGSDAKDYDNDGNVDIFYNNLMPGVAAIAQSGQPVPTCIRIEGANTEPAICRLEQWIHRLQQRRMEGHLLGKWRCRPGEREVAAT